MALEYFLKIDGVTGNSTTKGFEGWFTVDSFDIGVTTPVSIGSSGSGAGAGKSTFSPLTVDIHSLTGLASLFGDELKGVDLKSVELVAVESTKGKEVTVYDLKLTDARIGSLENTPSTHGVETALTFDYKAITLKDPTQQGPSSANTFSWNVVTNSQVPIGETQDSALVSAAGTTAGGTTGAPSPDAAVAVPASSPLHYFLKIDGVTGDSTDKNFAGWFTVDGFDIGVATPTSIGSASTGAGAGKAKFSSLTVDIHSLTGLASLFGDELKGVDLKSVELVAVESTKGKEVTVYDLKLTDARIGSLENTPSTHGVETALTFDYKGITLKDPTQQGPSSANTFSWNVVTNSQLPVGETQDSALVSAAGTTAGGTTGAPSPDAAVAVPASSPLHYFLKIDGVTGDSTDKNFAGWFTVDGFDIGVATPTSIGSASTGAGAGKTVFSPLSVDIHSLTGLASLFGDELKSTDLKSVELVAVESTKGKELTVYDLKLTDAKIGSLENTPSTHGVETALTFDYKAITLKDPTQQGPSSANTFSWNVVTNSQVPIGETQDSALVSAAGTTGAPSPDAAVAVPASSPLHYFLKIDGVTGNSTDKNFAGWFTVDGFDIGVATPTSIGSASTGAGAGKAKFSPLTVDIHSLTGLASLLGDELKGVDLKSVELVAVDSIKGKELTVYDLKLTDAKIGSFENDPGTHGVETALTFDYKAITLKDPTQQGPSSANTFSWNVVTNSQGPVGETQDSALATAGTTAGGTTGAPSPDAAVAVPASSPLHYFLKIDGVTGNSTDKNFAGWFTVDGFDIGVATPTSIGSASTGAGAGKAKFSPLTVDIHSLTGLASLLGDELKGVDLKSVELVAVESTKGKELTVYDLKLTDAKIGSFENTPSTHGVETALTFDYKGITLKDPTQQGPSSTNTFSWNVVTNSQLPVGETQDGALVSAASTSGASTSDPTTPVPVPASSPLHYFLKIDGVTGDSTDKNHKGWFTVDGYDIEVTTPTSIGSGSTGAGAGKSTFSPLTVDIHSLTGLAPLLGDELKGSHIKSVELVGVNNNHQTVYDLKLTDALVASFDNTPGIHGVETELSFDYKGLSLTDHPINPNGSIGKAETFSFDLTGNKATSILSSFMAASGGAEPLVTSLTHQDNPWLT